MICPLFNELLDINITTYNKYKIHILQPIKKKTNHPIKIGNISE